MNQPREKVLFFVAAGVMAVGMAFILYFKAFIEPARAARDQAKAVEEQIGDKELEVARGENHRLRMNKWAASSFGFDELKASEALRAHLIALLGSARLSGTDVTMTPLAPARIKGGGGKEVGWKIKARGPVDRVVDFLYLAQTDPRLHKLSGITWAPVPRSTDVDLSLTYSTVVPDFAPGEKPPELATQDRSAPDRLADPTRKRYALITQRDLFRPYIRRPPPPPPGPSETPAPPVNRLALMKVVGLPTWAGKPAVVVRDSQSNTTRTYKVGEEFPVGGKIVLVDYRPMPRADKPYLDSPSRVIVRVGSDHWAVELGQTLAEKRKLSDKQVPEDLRAKLEDRGPGPAATDEKKDDTQEVPDAE